SGVRRHGAVPDDPARRPTQGHLAADRAGHIDTPHSHAVMGALIMKPSIKTTLAAALAGVYAVPLQAASLAVEVELPRIDVAEYHRPYVAVWLQSADRQTVRDVAVWYDHK